MEKIRRKLILKDVFHAFLVKGARFVGTEELPEIDSCNQIPARLIGFSRSFYTNDYNQFIHFYELDEKSTRFLNNPWSYLSHLKQFKGVTGLDCSVCRDFPLVEQKHYTYLNHAFDFWLQRNDIPVIPNIRTGDERSYDFCFLGVPQNSVIAVGMHGCVKQKDDLYYAVKGIRETIKQLQPRAIVIYGALPIEVSVILRQNRIPFKVFKSDIATVFNQRKNSSNKTPFLPALAYVDKEMA
jgi:hypothetical protein